MENIKLEITQPVSNENLNLAFFETCSDELKSLAYLVQAVGDSLLSSGIPSDRDSVNYALYKIADHITGVAEALDEAQKDLFDLDPEEEDDE